MKRESSNLTPRTIAIILLLFGVILTLFSFVGCSPAAGTTPADSLGKIPTWMWIPIIGFILYLVVFKRKKKD